MRRARLLTAITWVFVLALTSAPAAFAGGVRNNGGQGWFGQTSDPVITNAMFLTIAFFPAVIIVFSVLQWWLDKRKHARYDAEKAREANADWRGGW